MAEHILIVDDEETLCEVLKLNLENEGYDVDIAFSAEQALTLDLQSYALDIVKAADPGAFIIITSANEIFGEGYRSQFTDEL